MKFKLRNILITVLAVTAVICSVIGIAACDDNSLKEITVENPKIEFLIGDEFTHGEDFKVYAHYNDGTKIDVTDSESLSVKYETGFDMNVAGDYVITLSYGNKKTTYTIYVGEFSNILKKIELDTQNVKKQYKLGESISFEGIKVTSTLENAQGNLIYETATNLRNFNVKIEAEDGTVTEEMLMSFGTYTVTVSKGFIKATYTVNVDGVDLSSVQGALAVASISRTEVASGDLMLKEKLTINPMVTAYDNTYKFGNNFTYVNETIENPGEYYMSTDSKGFFEVFVGNGNVSFDEKGQAAKMGGPRIPLWYNSAIEFGIENALNNLYAEARKASNKDLKETVNEETKTYTFTYSGLVTSSNNRPDFYKTTVEFTLGEKNNIKHAEFTQEEWENDQALLETRPDWEVSFKIDPETGYVTSNGRASSTIIVTVNQETGERTETNPYSREMFKVQSYDILFNGKVLEEDAVVNASMEDTSIYDMTMDEPKPVLNFTIDNIFPSTANLVIDTLYLNYGGSYVADSSWSVNFEGFTAYLSGSQIKVALKNGGVWKLILKTELTERVITINVTGKAPTSMTAQIRNESNGAYYEANSKLISINNGEVYFYGAVNKYANYEQSAVVTSANASNATIEKFTENGMTYFKFSATAKGEYTVRVTSAVASGVGCMFKFTVGDVPDFGTLLKGDYTTQDVEGNIYNFTFTPKSSGALNGTLNVTMTPTELNGTLITSEKKSEVYSYSADVDTILITVNRVSGDKLAVSLSVNAKGELVLTDAYDKDYVLTPVNN